MSQQKSALGYLWKRAEESGSYKETKSHSCVKEFKIMFPNKEEPQFVMDGLPPQYVKSKNRSTNR